jgi:hypothetical protein
MRTLFERTSSGITETAARVALAAMFFGSLIGQGVSVEASALALLAVSASLWALHFVLEGA